MLTYRESDGIVARILASLFEPRPEALDREGIAWSMEYHERMSRRGVENKPGVLHVMEVGPVRERRIIALPGRTT